MKITKDMTIAEVIEICPQSIEIMMKHGLHCVGCSVATIETLEEGILAHGGTEENIQNLVKEINNLFNEIKGIKLTDKAAEKIKQLLKEKNLKNFALRVKAFEGCCGPLYEFSFEDEPEKNDLVLEKKNIKLFIDDESLTLLDGKTVDYLESENGFKIK